MTTPPSTSDVPALPFPLPDEATLNRLAGEFYAALPGGNMAGAATNPGGGWPLPQGLPAPDAPGISTPPAPPTGPPPTSLGAANGASAAGFALPFVPETAYSGGYPAELPALGPDLDPTAGPFYFLGTPPGTNPTTSPSGPGQTGSAHPGAASTVATPYELPVLDVPAAETVPPDLAPLPVTSEAATPLSATPAPGGPAPAAPALDVPVRGAPTSSFYFLDESAFRVGGPFAVDRPVELPELAELPLDPHPAFDVHAVRRDFPILSETVNGKPLIWFDNAATTQKPQSVIDRLAYFYTHENSNTHRAAHTLAARATEAFENARDTVARFLGAGSAEEIVFVRGTTEGINLIAKAWGGRHVRAGDEIVISHLEHHANIVPWQMLAKATGAVIKVIPVNDAGELLMEDYSDLLSDRTKIVAVTQVSNALGTVTPVEAIVDLAHRAGAIAVIDGAQSVPHTPVDVTAMGADFFVFSGHKVFGPTGIGAVYGRREVLADTPPWQGGGNMITDVTLERALYQPPPGRFEAGTGNIADAIGLATALDYVERLGMANIAAYEHELIEHLTAGLREIPGLRLVGTAVEKASVVSFVLDGFSTEEVGRELDREGIAVRTGHHCAQPILRRLGVEATVRPSLALYNTHGEIDTAVDVVDRLARSRGR